jgi:hypothetical protein
MMTTRDNRTLSINGHRYPYAPGERGFGGATSEEVRQTDRWMDVMDRHMDMMVWDMMDRGTDVMDRRRCPKINEEEEGRVPRSGRPC